MNVCIALYKGKGRWHNAVVRYWTKSKYSHAELLMPDNTSITITPFDRKGIVREEFKCEDEDAWDFICMPVSPSDLCTLEKFYEETKGLQYDWVGMIASQLMPYHIKHRNRWYCSEWIAYALRLICAVDGLHKVSDMSPEALTLLLPHRNIVSLGERPIMKNWNYVPPKTWGGLNEPSE